MQEENYVCNFDSVKYEQQFPEIGEDTDPFKIENSECNIFLPKFTL